ncbi:MAG: SDR family NAD(P)-dependent oxidoreductase [Pirellulaceae bacterium]
MFESLQGKKALVTGASTGIGACIAELLATYGTHVGVHYLRNKEQADAIAEKVRVLSGWGRTFQGDLLDTTVQQRLVTDFVDACGGIDILINNAGGIYDYVHFSELPASSWDNTFSLNVKAPFFLMQQAFSFMKNNGQGRIINITTVSAKYGGSPYNLHYVASKAALDSLTKGLARAGAQHNILVNSIRCGLIKTPMQDKIPAYTAEKLQQRITLVPLQRAGTPQDIARMALHLASECGDYITGQLYAVSGGD